MQTCNAVAPALIVGWYPFKSTPAKRSQSLAHYRNWDDGKSSRRAQGTFLLFKKKMIRSPPAPNLLHLVETDTGRSIWST